MYLVGIPTYHEMNVIVKSSSTKEQLGDDKYMYFCNSWYRGKLVFSVYSLDIVAIERNYSATVIQEKLFDADSLDCRQL